MSIFKQIPFEPLWPLYHTCPSLVSSCLSLQYFQQLIIDYHLEV